MRRTTEDYVKTIYQLEKAKGSAHSVDVAETLGVTKPTVSKTVKRLMEKGYVEKGERRELLLTRLGERVAESVLERHGFFEDLLRALGVNPSLARSDACKLEHSISEESFAALKRFCANHIPSC